MIPSNSPTGAYRHTNMKKQLAKNKSPRAEKTVRTLFIEPYSGISGNMILAALLDCGISLHKFNKGLSGLGTDEKWKISLTETQKKGYRAKHLSVVTSGEHHGHGRTLPEIRRIIDSAKTLPEKVRKNASGIFEKLASAEAAVHGKKTELVHFHEVGALDAIIDIAGTCLAIHMLEIDEIISMPPPLGAGQARSNHGIIPVPAPATLELMKGFPSEKSDLKAELTTPTGAAILTFFTDIWAKPPGGIILTAGYGAGTYDLGDTPNILRVSVFQSACRGAPSEDSVCVLECSMDDFRGENFSSLGPLLLKNGAFDYAIIPATMKKNRPGIILQVFCGRDNADTLSDLVLRETSTIGIRMRTEKRKILQREIREVETPFGKVMVKLVFDSKGAIVRCKVESDSCISLAKRLERSYFELNALVDSYLSGKFLE